MAHAALFYGLYSCVARKLGVSPQHVRQVALGISRSKRVEKAIQREIRHRKDRIEECAA